jgi:hypothetical protein
MTAKKGEKQLPQKSEAQHKLENAFKAIAKTDNGQVVFQHIMQMCGFKQTSMIFNPTTHELVENSTIWNEAKRGVWLDLRKQIPVEYRNLIEKDDE